MDQPERRSWVKGHESKVKVFRSQVKGHRLKVKDHRLKVTGSHGQRFAPITALHHGKCFAFELCFYSWKQL
jgi:hypothetical protein